MGPAAASISAALCFFGGATNAIAGGGTLIVFPGLIALGLSAVPANVTNTVAMTAGYLGGARAQRAALAAYRGRLRSLVLTATAGGVVGAGLLLETNDQSFYRAVPYLVLFACALLAAQNFIKRRLVTGSAGLGPWMLPCVFAASVYGGYFGAGLGILLLAILGVGLEGDLAAINAVKQVLSLVVNFVAAIAFCLSGKVVWALVPLMAVGGYLGGHFGGKLVGRLDAAKLRAVVCCAGVVVAVTMWLR